MSDYLSGRELELKVGIPSYTENKTVLEVIGRTNLGVTTVTDLTASTLKVLGDFAFNNFTADGLSITGVITASRFISTVTTGTSPISVASSTLVNNLNAEFLNGYPGPYYLNASNLNSGFVPAARLYSANNFNVLGNLYVSNDLSVGGTSVILNAQSLQISDKDIVLGITTNSFGNDISSDLTANHGGIAIASTVGSPLLSLKIVGINSLPDTYKQVMWVKSGTFAGLNTDAFLFNYAVGVGTDKLGYGVRFATGALEVTDNQVRSNTFVGSLQGNAATATTSTNLQDGAKGHLPYQDSPGITTFLPAGPAQFLLLSNGPNQAPYWGPASAAAQAFTGITVQDEGNTVGITSNITVLNFVGPNVTAIANPVLGGIATVSISDYVSNAGYSTNSGIATYAVRSGLSTNVSGGFATVTSLVVSGPSTLGSVQISGGIVTATSFNGNLTGTATTSVNIQGGVQGSIPFQKSSGITSLLPPSLGGLVLITNGANNDPYWGPVSAASGSFGGITVQDEGNVQGTASSVTTVNFVGPNVTVRATSGSNGIATVTLADYVSNAGYSTNSGIATYSINSGISTNVIGGIASITSLNVSGISTIGTVQISGGFVTATTFSGNFAGSANLTNLNATGISTLGSVQVSSGIITASSGIVTYYGDGSKLQGVSAFFVVSQSLTNSPTYITFARDVGVSSIGVSTVGSNSFVFIPTTGFVGIGTTIPTSKLDVRGDVNVSGVVTAIRFSGDGSTITNINATSLVGYTTYSITSGVSTNVIGGIASVTSLSVSGIGTTIPVRVGSGNSIVVIDSMGEIGVGTANPQYPLDVVGNVRFTGNLYANSVISTDSNVGEIVRTTSGVLTTNSLNTVTIDNFSTTQYRSAKYVVQLTSQGSLIPGTSSVNSISGGRNYFPGTYSSVNLNSVSGVGSYGKATITVSPEFAIPVNSCIDGVFTASTALPSGITGVATNQTTLFTQNLTLSQRQQSQVSSLSLASPGVGYTATPSLVFSSPVIVGNTVPEVGVGSTATAVVTSMIVSNAVQTSAGFVTNIIPTIAISAPSIGVTATGLVSFGISTFSITNPGSGYISSPALSIAAPYNPAGFAATVGLGISTLNWVITGGSGYTDGDTPTITVNPINGIGTGANITGLGIGGTIAFTLVNPGFGYTAIPLISVTGGTGVGATVSIASMNVTNISIVNPGTGVTVGLARTNDITFTGGSGTGAGATVSTIVSTGITITNAGFGYSLSPAITYNPLNATTAQVGLGISAVRLLSSGLGYVGIPTVTTVPGPSIGTTSNAGFTTVLGYVGFAGTTIIAGPGYGATSVYYVNVLSNRTFNISTSIGSGSTPGTGIVGYGFSVGLSTSRSGTVSSASTTIITGITTTSITLGTPVHNNSVISVGTTVSAIGIGTITLSLPALNTGSITTAFNFGTVVLIGGTVNRVNVTEIGSGYLANNSIQATVSNFDRATTIYDSNVGSGFTFTVTNVVNNFQLSELLVLHSAGSGSTTAYLIEQDGIADTSELGEFSAALSGTASTIFNVNFTPTFAFNQVKFNRTLFTV
jgi:hypothetical protein